VFNIQNTRVPISYTSIRPSRNCIIYGNLDLKVKLITENEKKIFGQLKCL